MTLRHRGLTLVELLVSMTVLSLMMVLVSQAVYQSARVSQAAQEASLALHSQWSKGWSLRELFDNLCTPPEGLDTPMSGSGDSLLAFSTTPLNRARVGVGQFELKLEPDPQNHQRYHLIYRNLLAGPGGAWVEVARFGEALEFTYEDNEGRLSGSWPSNRLAATPSPDTPALPRAIALRRSRDGVLLHWYVFSGDARPKRPPGKMFWES